MFMLGIASSAQTSLRFSDFCPCNFENHMVPESHDFQSCAFDPIRK